jgi:hypothetical protein
VGGQRPAPATGLAGTGPEEQQQADEGLGVLDLAEAPLGLCNRPVEHLDALVALRRGVARLDALGQEEVYALGEEA